MRKRGKYSAEGRSNQPEMPDEFFRAFDKIVESSMVGTSDIGSGKHYPRNQIHDRKRTFANRVGKITGAVGVILLMISAIIILLTLVCASVLGLLWVIGQF